MSEIYKTPIPHNNALIETGNQIAQKSLKKSLITKISDKFNDKLALLTYTELEDWRKLKFDHYIEGRVFRETTSSFRKCFKSVFQVHHEFFNIWTHLIPAIIFNRE